MAKQCEICKSYYPDDLASCPQCTSTAKPPAAPPKKPAAKDDPAATVVGGGPSSVPPAPDTDLAIGGAVDLGTPAPLPGGPISGSAVNLGELFKKQQQPEVQIEMPSSHKDKPSMLAGGSSVHSKGSSMLAGGPQGLDVPSESMLAGDDPATMAAKMGGPPTMVGSAGNPTMLPPKGVPTQLASKATQLATGAAPQTKLAPAGAMEALAKDQPEDPKKTKIAAGAAALTKMSKGYAPETKLGEGSAPKTKLATPEEMEEAMKGPTSPKATKMAAGAAPVTKMSKGHAPETKLASTAQTTKLATPEEMEALLRGDRGDSPKATKMAAGAAPVTKMAAGSAPTTKLAPIDEMEALARGGPKATKMAAGAAPETRLAPLDEMEGDAASAEIEAREEATAEALLAEVEEPATAEVAEFAPKTKIVEVKPKRSRTVPLLIGMLLGTAACLALAVFDLLPVDALKDLVGIKKTVDDPNKAYAQATQLVDSGQFTEALAILKNMEDAPRVHALRGQALWLQYIVQKNGANLNKEDAPVVQARADFVKANNAEGTYWIGHMEELLSGPDAGKKHHQDGLKKFPTGERMFNGGADRIDAIHGKPAAGPQGRIDLNNDDEVAAALAFILIGFQAPENPPVAMPGSANEEPGFDYWKAARLAKQQDYAGAVEAMKKALDNHNRIRFKRIGKATNPVSDPTKEIFSRAAGDLVIYYQMKDLLLKNGYIKKGDVEDPVKTLEVLNNALVAAKLAPNAMVLAEIGDRLKKAGLIENGDDAKEVVKGIDQLFKEHKDWTEVLKALTDRKFVNNDQPEFSKGFAEFMKDFEFKTQELASSAKLLMPKYVNDEQKLVSEGVKSLVDDKKKTDIALADMTKKYLTVDGTLKGIVERLAKGEPPYLDPKTDTLIERDIIWAAVDKVMAEAYSPVVTALARATRDLTKAGGTAGSRLTQDFDLASNLAISQSANARLRMLLQQTRTPHEMLAIWLPVLNEDRAHKDVAEKAALDARRVLKDQGAGNLVHGQASTVQGMAQSNLGQFDEARASLAAALKTEGAGDLAWRTFARNANMELNDPYAYFIPRAEALQADRQFDAALGFASRGVDAFKGIKKDGTMLALRSVLRIEAAHAKDNSRVDPKDPAIDLSRKDAEAAIAAGATAEGNFALGRLAEELGQYDVAQKHYRASIKEHPDNDRFGAQVRVALARVIVKARERAALQDNRQGAAEAQTEEKNIVLYHPLSMMVAAVQVGQVDDDEFDPNDPALDEAIRLAEEAIKQGNYEGHLVKAQALARKRRYTDAILEYSLGLSKLSKNPEHAEGLRKLMEMHPAFKIPDGLLPPDPLLAERHYANGLRHYWAHRYADAEGEFLTAVRYHDQDARYMYFLGLARLNQNKREFALEAFRRGGILEAQKKPNRAAVSATLERVQGRDRELVNRYRP